MEDQKNAAETFNQELVRKSNIQTRVNNILKSLPVAPQADYPREEVVDAIIAELEEKVELHLSDRNWLIGKTKSGEAADLTPLVQEELLMSKYIDSDSVSKPESPEMGLPQKELFRERGRLYSSVSGAMPGSSVRARRNL
jgi:hypothetical protein